MQTLIQSNWHIMCSKEHEGHKCRSIIVDKEAGVKAIYCQDDNKIVKMLFKKSRGWTDAQALEHTKKFLGTLKSLSCISVDQEPEFIKVIAEKIDGETLDLNPNSPSFIFTGVEEAPEFEGIIIKGIESFEIAEKRLREEGILFDKVHTENKVFSSGNFECAQWIEQTKELLVSPQAEVAQNKGGEGSGNFGHGGRFGEVGGSSSEGGVAVLDSEHEAQVAEGRTYMRDIADKVAKDIHYTAEGVGLGSRIEWKVKSGEIEMDGSRALVNFKLSVVGTLNTMTIDEKSGLDVVKGIVLNRMPDSIHGYLKEGIRDVQGEPLSMGVQYHNAEMEKIEKGGQGSGNFDHAGRTGEVGGSMSGSVNDIPKDLKMDKNYEHLKDLTRVNLTLKEHKTDGLYASDKLIFSIQSPKTADVETKEVEGVVSGYKKEITYDSKLVEVSDKGEEKIIDKDYKSFLDMEGVSHDNNIKDSDTLWRGMSGEEYKSLIATGVGGSKGDWNIGEEQRGITMFADNSSMAFHYAGGFAPFEQTPTYKEPSYVVRIGKLPDVNPTRQEGEVAVKNYGVKDIREVYQVRLATEKAGEIELYRKSDGNYTEGSRNNQSQTYAYKKMDVGEIKSEKGGVGSGNFGHGGRVGEIGGSAPSDVAQTAFSETMRTGGASVNFKGRAPKDGYMVSPYKDREAISQFTKDKSTEVKTFKEYQQLNKEFIAQKNHYLGAWVDKDKLYLDISVNVRDKAEAMDLAKQNNQLAMWDVAKKEEVTIGKKDGKTEIFLIPFDATDAEIEELVDALIAGQEKLEKGGAGSGNFGHAGRVGEVGGSTSDGGAPVLQTGTSEWTPTKDEAYIGGSRPFNGEPVNPNGKDTEQMYRGADGHYTKERQVYQQEIIDKAIAGKTPVEKPTAYLMGGGPASGKSEILKSGELAIDPNHIEANADRVKGDLAEYQKAMAEKDPKGAGFVHEESSHITKEILKEGISGKYNTVLDGTGDSDFDKLVSKVELMKSNGHVVEANYVTVDVETAVQRNIERAEKTGRYVSEKVLRETYKSLSNVVPKALALGIYDKFNMWDNNGRPPVKIASAEGKNLVIHDQKKWDRFLAQKDGK